MKMKEFGPPAAPPPLDLPKHSEMGDFLDFPTSGGNSVTAAFCIGEL